MAASKNRLPLKIMPLGGFLMNRSQKNPRGFRCPVKGCPKRNKNLYGLIGIVQHMQEFHPNEVEKRLRLKTYRRVVKNGREVFVQDD